jgi:hypothetical protein
VKANKYQENQCNSLLRFCSNGCVKKRAKTNTLWLIFCFPCFEKRCQMLQNKPNLLFCPLCSYIKDKALQKLPYEAIWYWKYGFGHPMTLCNLLMLRGILHHYSCWICPSRHSKWIKVHHMLEIYCHWSFINY